MRPQIISVLATNYFHHYETLEPDFEIYTRQLSTGNKEQTMMYKVGSVNFRKLWMSNIRLSGSSQDY
jgi:hypothetical protein